MTDYDQLREDAARLRELIDESHRRLSKVAYDYYVTKQERCFILLNQDPPEAHPEAHLDEIEVRAERLREKIQGYDPGKEAVVYWDPDKSDSDLPGLSARFPLHEEVAP
jgi:hypothetical protein